MNLSLSNCRTQIYIDAANLLYAQKTLGWRIDYAKLKSYFEKECDLTSIHFYTARISKSEKQTIFLNRLCEIGFKVTVKEVKKIRLKNSEVLWKGNLDVELAIDVVNNLDAFDALVLVSGDSDFSPLLDFAKAHGKRVFVVSTKGHISKELLDRAKFINLRRLKDEIEYIKKIPPLAGREVLLG